MSHRIAFVIDAWDHPFNGTVVSTRRFAAALAHRGCSVTLLAIGVGDGTDPGVRVSFPELRIPGVTRLIRAMRSPLARPDRNRIRAALAGCDLLHVQYPFFLGWAAIREARAAGIPVVCSFHVQPENVLDNLRLAGPVQNRLLYRVFRRGIYDRADHVVAPSAFAAEMLRRHGISTPVTVVSNGVPESFFAAPRRAASPDRFRVLSVGRLAREKRQRALLQAVAASRHRERIDLTLAGAGPLQQRLIQQARNLGLRASIGSLDDAALLDCYRGADLFVHCGGVELEGMSVLEAMATGNVVLVADSADSAAPALVRHPECRFDPAYPAALAQLLDRWLEAPVARGEEGRANRARAAAFRHERCVDALLDVYREVVSGGARSLQAVAP